jgi:ribosome maturation factor RimP
MGLNQNELAQYTKVIDQSLHHLGYLCSKLEWDGRDKTLRVYIKKIDADPSSTINIEDCVKATKVLRRVDELDQIHNGDYTLEVSSPGI